MMKLNIYKNQHDIEKTYAVEAYDIMYGTVEDILEILDGIEDLSTNTDILKLIQKNRHKLNELLLDVFAEEGLTEAELRNIKIKELVPLFLNLFAYVQTSFKSEKN